MRRWVIRWVGFSSAGDAISPVLSVHDGVTGEQACTYSLSLGGEKLMTALFQLEPRARYALPQDVGQLLGGARVTLSSVLLEFNVERLERLLREGDVPSGPHAHALTWATDDDVERLIAMARDRKRCAYQLQDGRELLCTAATADDETRRGQKGFRFVAPTSADLCRKCALPAEGLLCSQLGSPRVDGMTYEGGSQRILLPGAMCAVGNDGANDAPARCRVDGHSCWQRVVDETDPLQHREVGPLSLHHALDYLDMAWRARHGGGHHLLGRAAAEAIGGLSQGCRSRADFAQRLNDLNVVLSSFAETEIAPGAGKHLIRLEEQLEGELQSAGADLGDVARMHAAVGRLRRLVDVRTAFAHLGLSRVDAAAACREAHLPFPLDDYAAAWDAVSVQAVDALLTLAEVVGSMPTEG